MCHSGNNKKNRLVTARQTARDRSTQHQGSPPPLTSLSLPLFSSSSSFSPRDPPVHSHISRRSDGMHAKVVSGRTTVSHSISQPDKASVVKRFSKGGCTIFLFHVGRWVVLPRSLLPALSPIMAASTPPSSLSLLVLPFGAPLLCTSKHAWDGCCGGGSTPVPFSLLPTLLLYCTTDRPSRSPFPSVLTCVEWPMGAQRRKEKDGGGALSPILPKRVQEEKEKKGSVRRLRLRLRLRLENERWCLPPPRPSLPPTILTKTL